MQNFNWEKLFKSIDNSDTKAFLEFLSDDVIFRFGNAEPVKGKGNVGEIMQGFFASIRTLDHEIFETWEQEDAAICHGIVTYTRHDGSRLTVPFANIFKMDGHLIGQYLIYLDVSRLYSSS